MLSSRVDESKLIESVQQEFAQLEESGCDDLVVTDLQRTKLDVLLSRAGATPHYRRRGGVAPEDFSKLEILDKDTVRSRPLDFYAAGKEFARYYETSGSTGSHTSAPRTAEDVILNAATVAGVWRRILPAGSRVACLLPSDVVPVADLVVSVADLLGCTTLRAYPFSQGITDWDRLEILTGSFAPDTLFVAPGVLQQWTRVLKQRQRLAETCRSVRRLMLLGEVSTPALRHKIGRDWAAVAFDASYGSTETGTVAASCEHDRLHCLLHAHLLELRMGEELRPLAVGAAGELVVTPLNSYARPLLRFATGDLVVVATSQCPCGLGLPVIKVRGRRIDQVLVKEVPLSVDVLESIVYSNLNVTGYLVQLRELDGAARLLLERDVEAGDLDEVVIAEICARSAAAGLRWDAVEVVGQLPVFTKAGGSRKSWKRTNVQWLR